MWGKQADKSKLEYRNHINRKTLVNLMITEQRLQHAHEFESDQMRILDRERNFNERLTSEMLHIKNAKNELKFINGYTIS